MADNITALANTGTGTDVFATDDIGGVNYPRTKLVIGADGVNDGDVSSANPLPVSGSVTISDPSTTVAFGPIATANTALFSAIDTAGEASIQLQLTGRFNAGGVYFEASNDGLEYHGVLATTREDETLVDTLYAPDLVTMPVTAKYFRAVTTSDFSGSVSGLYSLRATLAPTPFTQTKLVDVEPSLLFNVAGTTPSGYFKRIAVAENGAVLPADGTVFQGSRQGASVGPVVQFETTGYSSIALQLAGTFTGTITFQVSNDGSTWASAQAWPAAGGTASVSTATAVGQWLIAASGRFFRAQITTGGTGVVVAIAVLKNGFAFYPPNTPSVTIAANSAVNIAQVGGTATAAGGLPILASGATSGASVGTLIAAGTNNLTQIKGTIGRLFLMHVQNQVASVRYLKLFNLPSASVTMGTTSATMNFVIPASGTLNLNIPSVGLNMGGTGISFALTTGASLTDNTAVTASDLIVNYSWA